MNEQTIPAKIVRFLGIATLILFALPIALLLFKVLLSEAGASGIEWFDIFHIVSTILNLIAIPFILIGFIKRYRVDILLYVVSVHIILYLIGIIIILAGIMSGDISLLLIIMLPSVLYLIGWVMER